MKCRQDFVTNSSSSSFIFGLPGGNDLSVEILFRQMQIWSRELFRLVDNIDNTLKTTMYHKYEAIQKLRKQNYLELSFDDLRYRRQESQNNLKGVEFQRYFYSLLDVNNYKLSGEHFFDFYINEYNVLSKMKKFITYKSYNDYKKDSMRPFNFTIVDFKNIKDTDIGIVDEIVHWYCDEGDIELGTYFYRNYTKSEVKTKAYSELGEVAVYSDSNFLPGVLEDIMEQLVILSCGHMG